MTDSFGFDGSITNRSPLLEEPDNLSRISGIMKDLKGTEDPDDLMLSIIEALDQIAWAPEEQGAFFTFVYSPKTPNLLYDQHPLVEIIEITRWGFRGFNYHWNMARNYTFPEIVGPMHRVRKSEFEHLRTIPYQKFLTTPP